MRRAERIWEVLKGLEYTLKKRVFTTLTIRYFLYPKPRTQPDMEGVYTKGEGLESAAVLIVESTLTQRVRTRGEGDRLG